MRSGKFTQLRPCNLGIAARFAFDENHSLEQFAGFRSQIGELGRSRNQNPHAAIAENVSRALCRHLRVDRNIHSASFQNAEHADDRFHALGKEQCDAVALLHPALAQQLRQLV